MVPHPRLGEAALLSLTGVLSQLEDARVLNCCNTARPLSCLKIFVPICVMFCIPGSNLSPPSVRCALNYSAVSLHALRTGS